MRLSIFLYNLPRIPPLLGRSLTGVLVSPRSRHSCMSFDVVLTLLLTIKPVLLTGQTGWLAHPLCGNFKIRQQQGGKSIRQMHALFWSSSPGFDSGSSNQPWLAPERDSVVAARLACFVCL